MGDEVLSYKSKNFQLLGVGGGGGGLGLEVEELRTAKRVIGYFVLNLKSWLKLSRSNLYQKSNDFKH